MTRIGRLAREPMLQFLLVGAIAFALFGRRDAGPRAIVVDDGLRRALRRDFERRNGAAPSAEQEDALVRHWVDEEILVREALALGLDRGDVIVRRRLLQKMEFLAEEGGPVAEPDDATLQAWLDAHADRWRAEPRLRFEQVFVGRDRHGDAADADARALLARIEAGEDPASLGDPFLRGRSIGPATRAEIDTQFGSGFATRLAGIPDGRWSGPVPSSFGQHLVRVDERATGGLPPLAEVRAAVRHDWLEARREEARRTRLEDLRGRWEVRERP
ncbi:MAG: peptidyl-prolyl cis-trans isomerase [Alphaproteobacteria bacterium]